MSVVSKIGYHGTVDSVKNAILSDGFKPNKNPRHWLGYGVYFYDDDYHEAFGWAKLQCSAQSDKPCVIKVSINVEEEHYSDFDTRLEQQKLVDFAKALLSEKKRYKFVLKGDRTHNTCFLYDAYSRRNGKRVLKKTFLGNPLQSARELESIFDIPRTSVQVCVKKHFENYIKIIGEIKKDEYVFVPKPNRQIKIGEGSVD